MRGPVGLTRVRRRFLAKIAALYAVLTLLALSLPALAAKPRDTVPHPSSIESQGGRP